MSKIAVPVRPMPRYFYAMDVTRGLAALSVVFWHWQHFFYVGTTPGLLTPSAQPLYHVFAPLYLNGYRAVELFFALSGFIFTWLYAETIAERGITGREFAFLRFTRLYPLHFVTLLLVAVLQWNWHRTHGTYFIGLHNDPANFVRQLFFASHWSLRPEPSFNGPVWSVSVEVLLYGVFFVICRLRSRTASTSIAFMLAGIVLERMGVGAVGRGFVSFFVGTLCYDAYDGLRRRGVSVRFVRAVAAATLALWIAVPLSLRAGSLLTTYSAHATSLRDAPLRALTEMGASMLYELVLFPTTIIALALIETYRGTLGKRISGIGRLSYSSYLIHFPLQLAFATVFTEAGFFYSPFALLLFFACLIPLSLLSFSWLERPAQAYLRRRVVLQGEEAVVLAKAS